MTRKPETITQLNGCDELREWLIAQGFRVALDGLSPRGSECNWYAYRRSDIPARECECNDGKPMQIVIRPHKFQYPSGDTRESVEVDVTGEAGGIWFKLSAYSLTTDELRGRMPEIEAGLIAAWNALNVGRGDL